ncbi:peptidase family S41 [Paludibacter jiangxiensis]|uniref:Peptidase family S41 n=1 Tax=Paludibacter jiangxiensis TaxID=681398 RepID=A0A170YAV8_9BACT|nr:peptidase family S41 [Paludibacter jiangxiensis]
MRIGVVLLSFIVVMCGCVSVETFNRQLRTPKSVKALRSDVDFVHHKLEKLHPSLYRYISKQELDRKFDSLKTSIASPMTSNEFFFRISPVVASVRQGHTRIFPLTRRLTKQEMVKARKNGASPVMKLHLGWVDHRLYLLKTTASDSTLKPGSEILSLDSITPQQLFAKYAPTFASDGFNTTFHDRLFNKKFASYFYYETGVRDSVLCKVSNGGVVRSVWLKPPERQKKKQEKPLSSPSDAEKQKKRVFEHQKKVQGYDALTGEFSKNLRFMGQDSSVAVLTVKDFVKGKYKRFYADNFRKIDSVQTRALVLDLRDNTGGDLSDIQCLYSYLAENNFRFVKPAVVTSKTSLWHDDYFNASSPSQFALRVLGTPGWLVYNTFTTLITHKKADGRYYFYYPPIWQKHPKANRFKGKVYVLINGCSFSASSIISANLKGSGRAIFVGEETGGAYNGCVAGQMPSFTLPGSKLKMSFGLLEVVTPYVFNPDGRGVMPDVPVVPTLDDRLKSTDPELKWVMDNLDKQGK